MDIRVFTCNNIQLRINSTDSCDTEIIICATSTKSNKAQISVTDTHIHQGLHKKRQDKLK